MCPERDSNSYAHSAPPPQDGASANFATWAGKDCKGAKKNLNVKCLFCGEFYEVF